MDVPEGPDRPMKTRFLKIDRESLGLAELRLISGVLRNDGVMVCPTETFYGLGVLAFSENAVKKVYRLKERELGKPLSVVIADIAMAEEIAAVLPPLFWTLSREFWPGPLTLVVKARPLFPKEMLGPGGSLAMRIPDAPWLRDLIRHLNAPITATSANLSGTGEISRPEDIIEIFKGKVDLIIDGGRTAGGLPSTIVDLASDQPRLLRAGAVPLSRLQKYL
jgi:L-threonylcarbamoyladenylate synthase